MLFNIVNIVKIRYCLCILGTFCIIYKHLYFYPQLCAKKLKSYIDVAPYQADSHLKDHHDFGMQLEKEHGCRVISCAFLRDQNSAAFLAMLDGDGEVVDFLRLKHLMGKKNSLRVAEREVKVCACFFT